MRIAWAREARGRMRVAKCIITDNLSKRNRYVGWSGMRGYD